MGGISQTFSSALRAWLALLLLLSLIPVLPVQPAEAAPRVPLARQTLSAGAAHTLEIRSDGTLWA